MASLAALLLLVAWNMSEMRHFGGLLRIAPRSDIAVLLSCFLLTVFVDMVAAVSVGFVLAAILFMRRMAEITETKMAMDSTEEHQLVDTPKGVSFYEVNGPLFFGAAQNAMDTLHASHTDAFQVLVLHLGKVPVIDATGFAALENAIAILVKRKKVVIVAGPLPRPQKIFEKARLDEKFPGAVHIAPDLPTALRRARELLPSSQPLPPSTRARSAE
jgi:SulP family sulfate permease